MSRLAPRSQTIQSDIEFQLRGVMNTEAVEILARVMAGVVSRDIRQFPQLTSAFREAFSREHAFLLQRTTRTRNNTGVLL